MDKELIGFIDFLHENGLLDIDEIIKKFPPLDDGETAFRLLRRVVTEYKKTN